MAKNTEIGTKQMKTHWFVRHVIATFFYKLRLLL